FMRYYFLNSGNRVNLIGETSYEYGYNSSNNGASDNHNIFTISAGPVIYFNSSVGIELTANYELLNGSTGTASAKTVYFNIGFQIHLEKRRLSINYKY